MDDACITCVTMLNQSASVPNPDVATIGYSFHVTSTQTLDQTIASHAGYVAYTSRVTSLT
ncbi:hypothetical protein DPMN_138814 [Dreissena polymorpha]|uniref:Uncharacterized protein n=1 Tax=Dreissena polymorpha TaxID=45954 RepID=A0A9D4GAF9_DREPO|nr:hypothetical protein DPMN_138814 [Dreissena polymorpha]